MKDYQNETVPAGLAGIPDQPFSKRESKGAIKEKEEAQEVYKFGQTIECKCANCNHMKLSYTHYRYGKRVVGGCLHNDGCDKFLERE